jgi:hypothetical protein
MPPTLPDPVDTIERFAELSALLDDPFAEEEEILRASGLDTQAWEATEARWLGQLRAGGSDIEDLARRFGKTYRETTARLAATTPTREPIPETLPTGVGFLSAEAQPWRADAALIGREVVAEAPPLNAADTLEEAISFPVPPLPFFTHRAEPAPDATLELGAVLPMPALPFSTRTP